MEKGAQGGADKEQVRDAASNIAAPKHLGPVKDGGNMGRVGLIKAE